MASLFDQVMKAIEKEVVKEMKAQAHKPPKPQKMPKISVPAYQKAIFLSSLDGFECPKENYGSSIVSLLKDIDLVGLHMQLLEEGMLTKPSASQILSTYKANDLKGLLESKNIKTSGNKDELIQRLIESLSADELLRIAKTSNIYVLSDKGIQYITKYNEYVYVFKKESKYKIDVEEFVMRRKDDPEGNLFTILKNINKDHAKEFKYSLVKLASLEGAKEAILEDEMKETGKNKNKDILNSKMKYLYYSLNASDKVEAILKSHETGNPPKMSPEPEDFFNNAILKILENDHDIMLDYDINSLPDERSLPYCICPKILLGQIIDDYNHGKFNEAKYNKALDKQVKDLIKSMR